MTKRDVLSIALKIMGVLCIINVLNIIPGTVSSIFNLSSTRQIKDTILENMARVQFLGFVSSFIMFYFISNYVAGLE